MSEQQQKRYYRVMARKIDPNHPGADTLTHYAYAVSVSQAVTLVRRKHERPNGVYGVGLYRVVEVGEYPYGEEEEPRPVDGPGCTPAYVPNHDTGELVHPDSLYADKCAECSTGATCEDAGRCLFEG